MKYKSYPGTLVAAGRHISMLSLLFATAAYWTVHIDYPSNPAAYERIDARYSAVIREFYVANNLTPPPVWHLVTGDGAYIGLRPRGSMMDVATPQLPSDLSKDLNAKTAPISEATHKILREHHSELWHVEADLTNGDTPKRFAVMRVDIIDPPRDDEYNAKMKNLIADLGRDGVETLAWFSSYGDGGYHYIFSSDKPLRVPKLKGFGRTHDVAVTRLEVR